LAGVITYGIKFTKVKEVPFIEVVNAVYLLNVNVEGAPVTPFTVILIVALAPLVDLGI